MGTHSRRLAFLAMTLFVMAPGALAQSPVDRTTSLAALGKVWGLLKYHPGSVSRPNWDDALVEAVPRFKAAATQEALNLEVMSLLRRGSQAYAFRNLPGNAVSASASLGPAFRWIDDDPGFEDATRTALRDVVLAHRPVPNLYVSAGGGSGNPDFARDTGYNQTAPPFPPEEVRLLALFRYWNMVQYYFPCNDVMDREWGGVLQEMLPRLLQASNQSEYHLAVAQLTASINDAHASTSSAALSLHWGTSGLPIQLRLVEGRSVVTRVYSNFLTPGADIRVGDIVTRIDGTPVEARRAALRPLVNGSNEASLERNIHSYLVRTNAPRATLTVERAGTESSVDLNSIGLTTLNPAIATFEAQNNRLFSILEGNIGYLHLGLLQRADVPAVMTQLKDTRAIVFDLRNYPNQTLYDLLNYLNSSARPFVKFLRPDFDRPGTFAWTDVLTAGSGSRNAWFPSFPPYFNYTGRVLVLVNQETQSQAEYTAMAFRTVPGSTLVGSQTAGADGNVSLISLPGGISTYFSGLGVFYPDGRPTQRVGIVPDTAASPTIAGLRAGRDEVLEAALDLLR